MKWDARYGKPLTDPADSGRPATGRPFATLTLTWDGATNTLTASVDGREVARVVDEDFTSFSRVYLCGNAAGLFDDVRGTTDPPPPAGK